MKSNPWTDDDEMALRRAIEERYRERTPPQRPDEVLPGYRVMRCEMRSWAETNLHKVLPEMDIELSRERCRWYRQMAVRVTKEKDPAALPALRKYFKACPNIW